MSGTYFHTVAIALDQFAAAIFFNRADVTISSLCRVVQLADSGMTPWPAHLASTKFSAAQIGFLRQLAKVLNKIQTNHCELARQADLARDDSSTQLLSVLFDTP
jgi:hypothetical protein